MTLRVFAVCVAALLLATCASSRRNTTYNMPPYDYQGYHSPHQIP